MITEYELWKQEMLAKNAARIEILKKSGEYLGSPENIREPVSSYLGYRPSRRIY